MELQDESGSPLPSYTLESCREITGDEIEYTVNWKHGDDVSRLAGRPAIPLVQTLGNHMGDDRLAGRAGRFDQDGTMPLIHGRDGAIDDACLVVALLKHVCRL